MAAITMSAEEHKARKARSQKLLLWFAMASMTMMFAGITSAFVVSKSRPDWLKDFQLPSAFYVSTVLILMGSVTMHLAKKNIQKDQRAATTKMLWSTLVLGILFFACRTRRLLPTPPIFLNLKRNWLTHHFWSQLQVPL